MHNGEQKRNVFEMSNGLTGGPVMKFCEKKASVALQGTTDGIGALLLQRRDRKQGGKDAQAGSYIKN